MADIMLSYEVDENGYNFALTQNGDTVFEEIKAMIMVLTFCVKFCRDAEDLILT